MVRGVDGTRGPTPVGNGYGAPDPSNSQDPLPNGIQPAWQIYSMLQAFGGGLDHNPPSTPAVKALFSNYVQQLLTAWNNAYQNGSASKYYGYSTLIEYFGPKAEFGNLLGDITNNKGLIPDQDWKNGDLYNDLTNLAKSTCFHNPAQLLNISYYQPNSNDPNVWDNWMMPSASPPPAPPIIPSGTSWGDLFSYNPGNASSSGLAMLLEAGPQYYSQFPYVFKGDDGNSYLNCILWTNIALMSMKALMEGKNSGLPSTITTAQIEQLLLQAIGNLKEASLYGPTCNSGMDPISQGLLDLFDVKDPTIPMVGYNNGYYNQSLTGLGQYYLLTQKAGAPPPSVPLDQIYALVGTVITGADSSSPFVPPSQTSQLDWWSDYVEGLIQGSENAGMSIEGIFHP